MCCSKKGGIIIEYNLKNGLLKKGLVIVPMAILGLAIFSNTLYASNSITATKENRIKEIKIVEDINIDKLIRNKKKPETEVKTTEKKTNITSRKTKTTSRSSTTTRTTTTTTSKNTTTTKKTTTNKSITSKVKLEDEQKQDNKTYKSISSITISKNMNLTKRTGISKADFKKIMKNLKQDTSKFFYNNADTIYDMCEKYNINEIFFCGLISAESGWNIASNHRKTHNYISLMLKGKLIHYSSVYEGLEVAAKKLHVNYLTPGGKFYKGKTLEGVHTYFCPSNTWVNLVYGRMQQVMTAVNKTK